MELTRRLKLKAAEMGFSMLGIIEALPGRRLDAYHQWLANAYHGEMGYMARPDRITRREDLDVILPGVRSIICVGLNYSTPEPPPQVLNDPARGRISKYAWGMDYHHLMSPLMESLAEWFKAVADFQVATKVYVDTGAILERDHAETAGLGFTGKNTMLINPGGGSWIFLGELLTTAELVPDEIKRPMPECGTCSRCLTACPTQAFPEPYVLDARRCISYLTIELKGWIPRELRPLMGNWVVGCDVCQVVCPFNRFAQHSGLEAFHPANWDAVAPPLLELLEVDEATFAERFATSPIIRLKRRGLVRNACVAAGNWGSYKAVGALARLLADDEPIIRGHAAWALGRIGGKEANDALRSSLKSDGDEGVQEELRLALE